MAFPSTLTNAVDAVTEVVAAHLNNLETKVGIDGSLVSTSLDYLLKNPASVNPGHKHSSLWSSDGALETLSVSASGMTTIRHAVDEDMHICIQPGATAEQRGYFAWYPYTGGPAYDWLMGRTGQKNFIIFDGIHALHRLTMFSGVGDGQSQNTDISSCGTSPVTINAPGLDQDADRGTGGLVVCNGGAGSVEIFSAKSTGVTITDRTALAAGVGGVLKLAGAYRADGSMATFGQIQAVKEVATEGAIEGALVFKTLRTGLGGVPAEYMRLSSVGYLGIGTNNPQTLLHIYGNASRCRFEDSSSGYTAITRTMGGFDIVINGLNITNKYFPALKFMSKDADLTTENPKLLAAILARATENFYSDTAGGTALDFATTPNNPGAASVPLVRMSINQDGNAGIGTTTPSAAALLHLSSATKGFLPPVMTTTQKTAINSPPAGLMVYDSTLNKLCVFTGAAWETITSS
jgi:hypothetical protein